MSGGKVIFYVNGVAAFSAKIGDRLVFDAPGYSQIWLTQYQNGVLQYDGPESVPTSPLLLTDPPDVGVFQGTAFEVINGQKGAQIDSWTFQITAAGTTPNTSTPQTGVNAPGTTCSTGLCTANPPPASVPGTVSTIPVPVNTGGGTTGSPTTTPSGGGGLSPFGDLPGSQPPSATTGTGGPDQGSSGATQPAVTTTSFSFSGFTKSPLFWLVLALLVFVYFMSE